MASINKPSNQKSEKLLSQVVNPFLTIQNEVDKALHGFYDLFEPQKFNLNELENTSIAPSMDLVEDKDCFKIECEMPGMDEKDVKVSLNENLLTISGEKTTSTKDAKKNYISREINYGRYVRTIALPQNADGEKASASFKKGMLWIEIPKKVKNSRKSHEIKIKKA